MPVKLILSAPVCQEQHGQPDTIELGPFSELTFDGQSWFTGDEKIAETYIESFGEVTSNPLGFMNPHIGAIFTPRTFNTGEEDVPGFPGKPYENMKVVSC